jgi:hypothetical protein
MFITPHVKKSFKFPIAIANSVKALGLSSNLCRITINQIKEYRQGSQSRLVCWSHQRCYQSRPAALECQQTAIFLGEWWTSALWCWSNSQGYLTVKVDERPEESHFNRRVHDFLTNDLWQLCLIRIPLKDFRARSLTNRRAISCCKSSVNSYSAWADCLCDYS